MGVVYYGSYPLYYEAGRTELLREIGISYSDMEDKGIILPVVSLNIKYIAPVYYDELITIFTSIPKMPGVKLYFEYEIYNSQNKMVNNGNTTLAFIDRIKNKPVKAPLYFFNELKKYF
jgi:acyl-CoA thioester hydrolase